jgi:hypothetical protein
MPSCLTSLTLKISCSFSPYRPDDGPPLGEERCKVNSRTAFVLTSMLAGKGGAMASRNVCPAEDGFSADLAQGVRNALGLAPV